MEAAAESNDPACAAVMVQLPTTVAGFDRRWTDAQATAAWGTPSAVLMTCGVPEPGPSTLRCDSVAGVDWLIDDTDAPRVKATTYGRTPALELFFDIQFGEGSLGRQVLDQISPIAAQHLDRTTACVSREDATPVN